jgi:hypothetical protein
MPWHIRKSVGICSFKQFESKHLKVTYFIYFTFFLILLSSTHLKVTFPSVYIYMSYIIYFNIRYLLRVYINLTRLFRLWSLYHLNQNHIIHLRTLGIFAPLGHTH